MQINQKLFNNHNFSRFLENQQNKNIYNKYLTEPCEKNAIALNNAYKKFERQWIVRSYLKKAIIFEAKRFDAKLRKIEKNQLSIDSPIEDGLTIGELITDDSSINSFEKLWDTELENLFEDPKLFNAMRKLTKKQKQILYEIYIQNVNEKEIAMRLNVTQQAISKIHRAAIKKLREVLTKNGT